MSKQQTLALAAKLFDAQQGRDDGEMVVIRSGSAYMRVKSFNAGKRAEALKNCHRKPRAKAELRSYPKFTPGMSTAEYVISYGAMNKHGVLPGMSLNTEPCALYENGALDFDVIEESIEDEAANQKPLVVKSGALDFFPVEEQIEEMPPVSPQIDAMTDDELIEALGVEVPEVQAVAEVAETDDAWLDVLTSSVDSIGSMDEGDFSRMMDIFTDCNHHSEALMMRCLRAGRVDLAAAVAHLVRFQKSEDYQGLNGVQCEASAAVSAMLAGEPTDNISGEAVAILESWGLVMRKPQASPAFVALMAQAREAKRISRRAIAQAIASSLREVDDVYILRAGLGLLAQEKARNAARSAAEASRKAQESAAQDGEIVRMVAEFPDLEECPGHGGVGAAKNIRRVLKKKFPGVKFSVKSDYSSCNIKWQDGPTDAAVSEAVAPFDIGYSDSMTDYFTTVATKFSETFGGVQYLFTKRELGAETIKASIKAIYGDNGPTYEEWQAGRAWRQVANHGNYGPNAYGGDWDWLSQVRRHANGLDY